MEKLIDINSYPVSVVLKAILKDKTTGKNILRESLIQNGVIVNGVFVENHTFTSSSAAAAVVLGRSANGRKEWTLLDGRTYGKYGQVEA